MLNRRSALTFVEMLILVAVVAILAMVSVPSAMRARVRAGLANVDLNLYCVGKAMEAYALDHVSYPAPGGAAAGEGSEGVAGVCVPMSLLTTPIAYGGVRIDVDPFRERARLRQSQYRIFTAAYAQGRRSAGYPYNGWMSWSVGPDGRTQTGGYRALPAIQANERRGAEGSGAERFGGMRYDPTNGLMSGGDIYRFAGFALTELE